MPKLLTPYLPSLRFSVAALLTLCLTGCRNIVSVNEVTPSSMLSASQTAEELFIPQNPNSPIRYFTIEKVSIQHTSGAPIAPALTTESSRTIGALFYEDSLMNSSFAERQHQITAQLSSSILAVKNFRLIDFQSAKKKKFKFEEKGGSFDPILLLRAELTEYEERITETGSKIRLPLIYQGREASKTGTLALDISVVDPTAHGKIVHAFPIQSSFRNVSAESDPTVGAVLFKHTTQIQSSIDQALRVATTEVARELHRKFIEE